MNAERKNVVVMLDSGAFTVYTKGTVIKLEDYAAFVHGHAGLFRGGVFNLDHIHKTSDAAFGSESGKRSYENWIELRRLGVDSIPIHHIGEDETYLKKYMDQTDYIGFGAIARMPTAMRIYGLDHIWNTYLKNPDGTPRYRAHGLGLTSMRPMLRYPWFSVDSTRAVMFAAHGGILIPKITESGVSYDTMTSIRVSNQVRRANRGQVENYFALSNRVQNLIRDFCSSFGFDLDTTIEGRALNPLRKDRKMQDPKQVNGLEIIGAQPIMAATRVPLGNENAVGEKNLSVSWIPRFIFNLHVTDQFLTYWRSKGKTIRMYHVVGKGDIFNIFMQGPVCKPANRCLVSYARLPDSLVELLRKAMQK